MSAVWAKKGSAFVHPRRPPAQSRVRMQAVRGTPGRRQPVQAGSGSLSTRSGEKRARMRGPDGIGFGVRPSRKIGFASCPSGGEKRPWMDKTRTPESWTDETRTRKLRTAGMRTRDAQPVRPDPADPARPSRPNPTQPSRPGPKPGTARDSIRVPDSASHRPSVDATPARSPRSSRASAVSARSAAPPQPCGRRRYSPGSCDARA